MSKRAAQLLYGHVLFLKEEPVISAICKFQIFWDHFRMIFDSPQTITEQLEDCNVQLYCWPGGRNVAAAARPAHYRPAAARPRLPRTAVPAVHSHRAGVTNLV